MSRLDEILAALREELIKMDPKHELRDLFVFSGIELELRRMANIGEWQLKVAECSRCGSCCSLMTGKTFPFSTPNGCQYLIASGNEKLCGLTYYRPNGCAVAELDYVDECTVEWGDVK